VTAGARSVVLVSGGLDSATTLAIARSDGFEPYALSFRYGQRHAVELEAARRVAEHLGAARHVIVDVDLRRFGGSALTDDIAVPKHGVGSEIPLTYVPARNLIFLSLTVGFAEAAGASDIFIGVNALDYSGYPDCRPEFIASFATTARLATKAGVEGSPFAIHAPLQHLGKAEIAAEAARLGLDAAWSWSCYDPAPDGRACGLCDSCRLRLKGFADAGLEDPLAYAAMPG
jgi:7-cyano-7-deazaguanine synthase